MRSAIWAAYSRSRRHLQPQASRSLREQRHLPMARLRPWQQQEAHDSGGRGVPAPFLLHLLRRGFVRIRNFGFLANRQRAILLPLCFELLHASEKYSCFTGIAPRRSASVAMELSPLRWKRHVVGSPRLNSCFALHLNPNGASMNLYPHPRHLLVPWHARRTFLSHRAGVLCYLFLPAYAQRLCDTSPLQHDLKGQIIPITAGCLNLRTRSAPFKVHSLPPGRLPSSRCIERPGRIMRLPTVSRWALQIQH